MLHCLIYLQVSKLITLTCDLMDWVYFYLWLDKLCSALTWKSSKNQLIIHWTMAWQIKQKTRTVDFKPKNTHYPCIIMTKSWNDFFHQGQCLWFEVNINNSLDLPCCSALKLQVIQAQCKFFKHPKEKSIRGCCDQMLYWTSIGGQSWSVVAQRSQGCHGGQFIFLEFGVDFLMSLLHSMLKIIKCVLDFCTYGTVLFFDLADLKWNYNAENTPIPNLTRSLVAKCLVVLEVLNLCCDCDLQDSNQAFLHIISAHDNEPSHLIWFQTVK